jgi:hypothetical protein
MSKVGRNLVFHGAFKLKKAAKRHERVGEFILPAKVKGKRRYLLVSRRKK